MPKAKLDGAFLQDANLMDIRTLEDLRALDERAAFFVRHRVDDKPSSELEIVSRLQEMIARSDLVGAVPEEVRSNFERLRGMHAYGGLAYDLYSVVEQTHAFVLEQALGQRFVQFYEGAIPFMDKSGTASPLEVSNFRDVFLAISPGGSHHKERLLRIPGSAEPWEFHGSLKGLHRWAIRVGLLRGQQNRFREDCMRELRNMSAHPTGHTLTGPLESAHAIRVLAETVNYLWGATTAEGSRYAPPLEREVLILGRSADGESRSLGYPTSMNGTVAEPGWDYFVVRGRRWDESLMEAEPPFNDTNLPADLLWGPGGASDALAWIDREQPASDSIDHLDRVFLVNALDGQYPEPVNGDPSSIEVESGAALIRADFPLHALGHVRALREPDTKHSRKGFCAACPVETVRDRIE